MLCLSLSVLSILVSAQRKETRSSTGESAVVGTYLLYKTSLGDDKSWHCPNMLLTSILFNDKLFARARNIQLRFHGKMSKIFYKLGKMVGPNVRKAKWLWQTATNSQAEAIKAEYEVGKDIAHDVQYRLVLDHDLQIVRIISEVGSHLASHVSNKLRSFSFKPFKGNVPQAFCLPGGFIFVSRSLIELCQREKHEIAFILGHEMAHVIRGHVMERMIINSAIAAASRSAPVRYQLTACLRKVGIKFLESAYSEDQELEADKLGIRLVTAAGYDPHSSIRLFSRLAKSANESTLGNYFCSHPPCKTRIDNIIRLLK